MTRVPHFDLPFRFDYSPGNISPSVQVQEQDTLDDITNCVEIVLRYRIGFRSDVPSFGIVDPVFDQAPLPINDITASLVRWEPRVTPHLQQALERLDPEVTDVLVQVSGGTN